MTNKMINNEMMNDMELDEVSGGTVAELQELRKTILEHGSAGNSAAMVALNILEDMEKGITTLSDASNLISAYAIEHALNKCYGVKANISVGLFGTGRGEKNDTYDGRTHQQVLDLINK